MNAFVSPNSVAGNTDSQRIAGAISLAKQNGTNMVVIPRKNERTGENFWTIDQTIALPSDIEIVFDNAHLILAEGKYLNMFTAGEPQEDGALSTDATKNITLRGIGNATLDGGVYNGLSERNYKSLGIDIYRNTTMLFFNVDGLTVENLAVVNQRWWGITNVFVRNATYRNIRFKADYSRVVDGVHYPDQIPQNYEEIYVKNADGIDLRIGCHNFTIQNITGFVEDDGVALTALGTGEIERGMFVRDMDTAIHDVTIENVSIESRCSNVRLLNDNGHKLYNVTVNGVTSLLSGRFQNGSTIRIGDMAYAKAHSTLGDTHDIHIRNLNVHSYSGISIVKGLVDSTIENLSLQAGAKVGVRAFPASSATLKNCKIDRILFTDEDATAIDDTNMTFID